MSTFSESVIKRVIGEEIIPNDEAPCNIMGSHKDYTSRGRCREHWYRMVYRNNQWTYVSSERLPSGTFLAADRNATAYGDVWVGEVIAQHDKGGKIDTMWIVVGEDEAEIRKVEFTRTRDGRLKLKDIDVSYPDPRR